MTLHGSIVIHKEHPLAKNTRNFAITPCLQELICFIGMQHTYSGSNAIFQKLLGIEISAKQIERVCTFYGTKLYEMQCSYVFNKKDKKIEASILYVLLDGSFIQIRNSSLKKKGKDFFHGKDSWKEVKLGRIINARHIIKGISKDRNFVSKSDYVVHLGEAEKFLEQLRQLSESYKYDKLVFICDGAKWIWNWVEDCFPNAIKILDYFHAAEHLGEYALNNISDEALRKDWLKLQQERLLSNNAAEVIEELESEILISNRTHTKANRGNNKKLSAYLKENSDRMQYGSYKKQGLEIGSGAIESAHRVIIQQRAKLSGQRWSIEGAQSILSLRAAYHGGKWNELTKLLKM